MIFVIGGYANGKRTWVCNSLGYSPEDMSCDLTSDKPVLIHLESANVSSAQEVAHFDVVVCDEIGSGIVPIDAAERARRERVGRLSCEVAAHADTVVRVVCGIGTCIKGSLEGVSHS